jgi:hypothetical protein
MEKTITEKIIDIDNQIRVLEIKRFNLVDQLNTNGSFLEKLKAWDFNTRKGNASYFMKSSVLPNLVKYCSQHEVEKGTTIFIDQRFEIEIGTILDEENWQTTDKKTEYYVSPLVIKCLEEAIKENIVSFTFDY